MREPNSRNSDIEESLIEDELPRDAISSPQNDFES